MRQHGLHDLAADPVPLEQHRAQGGKQGRLAALVVADQDVQPVREPLDGQVAELAKVPDLDTPDAQALSPGPTWSR